MSFLIEKVTSEIWKSKIESDILIQAYKMTP